MMTLLSPDSSMTDCNSIPHISVCICTFKRPEQLKRLLSELARQVTGGRFTYSVSIADNDAAASASATVDAVREGFPVPISYAVEPERGIAPTRNRALAMSKGEYIAFIDDDEFPVHSWLFILLDTCQRFAVDGVLGPVRRHFDEEPPAWLKKSRLYDRRVNQTGMDVTWTEARTGNVLFKSLLVRNEDAPFRTQFRVGEDQDFFRRKIEEGNKFIWCAEAEAFEVIPASRWSRRYLFKKALLRGACAALQPTCTPMSIVKSVLAVVLYTIALPFTILFGQHHAIELLVKILDHVGKLCAVIGIQPIKEAYVAD